LPDGPDERSLPHGASPVAGPVGCNQPAGSAQETPHSRGYGSSVGVGFFRETTA
jgi:hypothetical protein